MRSSFSAIAALSATFFGIAYWAARADDVRLLRETHAAEDVEVGGIVDLLRLAIPAGDEVGEVLRRDVLALRAFWLLDRRHLPAALLEDDGFERTAWREVGADVVIKNAEADGRITFELYDLAKGERPTLSRSYPSDDRRKAAHRFMNEVIAVYTGTPGVCGSRIAFVRTRRAPGISKNIFTMEMDGGGVVGVTANRSLNVLPSLGPGGQVLFTSYAKRNPDLWVSDAGPPVRISHFPGLNLGGVMSPRGDAIALALSRDGNSEIYTLGMDGAVRARLTDDDAIDGAPTWSPTGDQLAFVSTRAGGSQVFRMRRDGGAVAQVTLVGGDNQAPDWRPGEGDYGQWIAYAGREETRLDIFSINVKTGRTRRLTHDGGRNSDPSWAPDGRMIAFSGTGGIMMADPDGTQPMLVRADATTPDWGPRMPE